MALSRIARVSGSAGAGDSVCTAGSALTVQAGDIIVLGCGYSPNGLSISIVDTDGSTNALTALAEVNSGNGFISRCAYRLSCAADASGTIRVTLGSDTWSDWGFVAYQLRPDSGDTVALSAGPAGAGNTWSTAAQTANISVDADDWVALVAIFTPDRSCSGLQIADGACDDSYQVGNLIVGVRAFTAAQSSIHGQATLSSEGAWAATILAITSTGSSEPPFPPHYRRRDNPLLRR